MICLRPALMVILLPAALAASEPSPPLERGRKAASALTDALRARLSAAMKDGGPVAAIDVCSTEALDISRKTAKDLSVDLRRTSLRLRNPANAPDAWEKATLEKLAAASQGSPLPEEILEPEMRAGRKVWRYAKPIVVATACLACHGPESAISAGVRERLAAKYPGDRATGYAAGDLRGIVSVTIPE